MINAWNIEKWETYRIYEEAAHQLWKGFEKGKKQARIQNENIINYLITFSLHANKIKLDFTFSF